MIADQPAAAQPGSESDAASIDKRMAKGAVWMLLARSSDRAIGLISTITLARLLAPGDFGLVAMGTAVVAMLELVGFFGFDVALIRNPSATRKHFDTAWTFNVLLGGLVAIALVGIAPLASRFYDEPRLVGILQCLALAAFVQGFENIGVVTFRKELQLHREFKLLLVKRIVVFAVTIPLAFILRTYWALVVGILVGRFAGVPLTYWVHEYRPRFSFAARAELLHFGKWLVLGSAVSFVSHRCADFIVGRAGGAHALGLFNVSYEISNLPTSDLIAPINRAVFPGYAKKAHDLKVLRRGYLDVMGIVATLAIPAAGGIAAVAEILVPLMLGPQWIEAVPIVATLALYGVLLALQSNAQYVYLALGKPRTATLLGAVQLAFLLPAVTIGAVREAGYGAALGYVAAQICFAPISIAVLCRALALKPRELGGVLYRPLAASLLMYIGVRFLAGRLDPAQSTAALAIAFGACVGVGALLYIAALYSIWRAAGKPVAAERVMVQFLRGEVWARVRRVLPTSS